MTEPSLIDAIEQRRRLRGQHRERMDADILRAIALNPDMTLKDVGRRFGCSDNRVKAAVVRGRSSK